MTSSDPRTYQSVDEIAGRPRLLLSDDEALLIEVFTTLHRMVEAGDTLYQRRKTLRDNLIRRAADACIPGDDPWPRAVAVEERVRTFLARRWPAWRNLPAPPERADELDMVFWHVCRMGARLPETDRHYFNVLAEMNDDVFSETTR